ncbi:probable peroxisome assembly protein [Cephalotrichum gorgonifer]|uniref:Probable peroxisome assembly protein n=1 Tax=Cephalotrichum gorgonifer TaxID=2041049 RepID=A0AAE8MXG2_9PEZI|nr:probable peroxisome assembly protein [Cephalotrichum gorgonifer]
MTSTSFADAVKRLAERRERRELAARRASAETPPSQARERLARLPPPLSQLPAAWDRISGCEGTRPAFRVGQVDAELLDEELLDLLKGQAGEALKYFSGGHLKDDWSAEIQFLLRAVLFKLSIWDHDASYGASLQNLKYTDARQQGPVLSPPTKWQKGLYGLVTVVGKYGWTKWEDWLVNQDDGYSEPSPRIQRLTRLTTGLSTAHSAAALVSFLVFLLQGRYRTLLDRVLRLRLAPPTSQVSREVSFEYQNRQLVWHAFTEFLLFILPLVGVNRWRRWLARTWRRTKDIIRSGSESTEDVAKGELAFLPERTCAICYQDQNSGATTEADVLAAATSGGVVGSAQTDITNAYEAIPCGCIYCFVCIATKLEREEGEGWTCLRCGDLIKECKPWNGDVLEPSRPGSKTVAFSDEIQDARVTEIPRDEELSQSSVPSSAAASVASSSDEFEQAEYDVAGELSDE